MSDNIPSVGIDFGTTNSSMAWFNPRTGTAEVILNAEGQPKTPSLVYFGETEVLVGELVEDLLAEVSIDRAQREDVFRRTIMSIKRNLLSPPRIALPGNRYVRPVEVAAQVLKKLKRDAEDGHFHEEIRRAVITCPAEFNVLQRDKIGEAGRLAGFGEVVLLEEPVAGALAYARAGLDVGKHVLVYDLGGGTFDLAVLDNEDESFHVAMEPKGMERCGGDDFDHALYYHCDEIAREELGRPISLLGGVDLSFLRRCRKQKESLAYQERGRFSSYLSSEEGPVRFEQEVDRETFDGLIDEYVETTTRLTEEILKQADAAGHEVDTVVLVGGSTRVLLVKRMLEETLPVDPLGFDKRDVAVALGAAHYTNIRWPVDGGGPDGGGDGGGDQPGPIADPSPDQYREAVEAVRDRKLDKVEVDRLSDFARQLGLSREQTAEIERRILGDSKEGILYGQYRRAVEMVWSDGELNGLEVEWLGALAGELGLDRDQTSRAESEIMGAAREAILERQAPSPEPPVELEGFGLAYILTGHSDEVNSVAFSPDGQFLASGASDHTVRGWNTLTGQPVGVLAGHSGRVNSVTFSPDGGLLASGGFDKSVRLWKLPKGEPFHNLNHADWVFSVAVGTDSKTLASGGADKEIKLWNLETGGLLRALTGHSHWVLSVAFGPDGRSLVSGGADKMIRVWNLETGEPLRAFEHPGWVWSVAVSPDSRRVFSGSEDGAIRVWDLKTGELVRSVTGHLGPVLSVAVGPDGQILFSGGSDGKVKIWNLRTGEPLNILSGHPKGVGSIAPPSRDGQLLASGGHDHAIKLWRKGGAIPDPIEETAERRPFLPAGAAPPPPPPGESGPGRPPDLPGMKPPEQPSRRPPSLPDGPVPEQPSRPPNLPGGPGSGQPGRPPNLPGGPGPGPSRPPNLPG